jgi:hypothetical protein
MPVVTRRRRPRTQGDETALAGLKARVDALIKENRTLKRQLLKLRPDGAARTSGRRANPVATGLARIKRKLDRALSAPAISTARRGRRAAGTTVKRPRRPASPEVQAKRLVALARAREVRAARKAAQTS